MYLNKLFGIYLLNFQLLVSPPDSNIYTKKYKTIFKKFQCNDIVHKSSKSFEITETLHR